jgi:hypothetical protein
MSAIKFENAVVASILEEAIEFCARKTGLKEREKVLEAIRRGECSVCEYLRYALAKGVARYLGSMDDTVKAIYVFEPEYATGMDVAIPGRPNFSPGINMIARVSRKSAALSSVVASLNSALAEECKQLACPKANSLCFGLDVEVADESEVLNRTGYGALISSLSVRPMEVWQR